MSLLWYFRFKFHSIRESRHSYARSPRTFMYFMLILTYVNMLMGDRTLIIVSLVFLLISYFYLDYSRGVPRQFKNEWYVNKAKKEQKEVVVDG